MKVYVLAFYSRKWARQDRMKCTCGSVYEFEAYATREAAEAAAVGKIGPAILEKEVQDQPLPDPYE